MQATPTRRTWLAVAIILAVTAGLRVRLLDVPLERDEGEYAYAGQLMLQGLPPYKHVYSMKWPGTFAAYAAIMSVFGETSRSIHTGLIVVNGLSIVLVFLIGCRLLNDTGAVVAAAFYAMLSLSRRVDGFTANCEHFVLVPALAGLWMLLRATASEKEARPFEKGGLLNANKCELFLSGLLLGSAPLFKQHGATFLLFGGGLLIYHECIISSRSFKSSLPRLVLFASAAVIPFTITCIILASVGAFDKFWLWTMQYPRTYIGQVPWSSAPGMFWDTVGPLLGVTWPIALLAFVGVVVVWRNVACRESKVFLFGLLLFGFLSVLPGLYFRPHYFVFVLPAAALFAAVGVEVLCDRATSELARQRIYWGAVVLPLAMIAAQERAYLFQMTPAQIARQCFPMNPFVESVAIAKRIREVTPPAARVAVIGSEPQICFLAGRRLASGYIYTYPLMEQQPLALDMQQEMIAEIEAAQPDYLVYVALVSSWVRRPYSRSLIFDWSEAYTREHFRIDGIVDMHERSDTEYLWGEDVSRAQPESDYRLILFQRK